MSSTSREWAAMRALSPVVKSVRYTCRFAKEVMVAIAIKICHWILLICVATALPADHTCV
jgi:hypothetical protein